MASCAAFLKPKCPNVSPVFHKGAFLVPEHVEIINLVDRYCSSILIFEPERALDFALKKANPAH